MYIIWFFIILSVVPYGETLFPKDTDFLSTATLSEARELGQPATIPLAHLIGGQILILAVLFTLFSTFTSFLGFGISLQDSFFDLKFKKISALVLAVLPPLFFSFWHPTSFLKSLDFAGLYGAGLFVGILPALMVLKARRRGDRAPEFVIFGKSIIPWLVFFIFIFGLIYNTVYSFF